ncbi:MAG: LuxR family transcriptional regulator [Salinarimonas sp.]
MLTTMASAEFMQGLTEARCVAEGEALLARAIARHGVKHYSYLCLPGKPSANPPTVITSYDRGWVRRYDERDYVALDPVVAAGMAGLRPFDWGRLDRSAPAQTAFFGEAREFGLGDRGLSFPFRGSNRDLGLFSLNADLPERTWEGLQAELLADFAMISYTFHAFASAFGSSASGAAQPAALTPRERECLAWCAAGKTLWDISLILGVSERTVRFHLGNARGKLDAVNTTHAVACAIHLGLIEIP